ncbi:hypothetical protein [Streptomyces sp. 8L]|uniref:hypothetical protein n=1 Tax=Streptomyces sp. 8L TaxID=2877242 RepID=UPI001CD4476C|nr:hypothetical protein [Streptomyces sp. 8L]MCA1224346.1 hypothetical protein [Streptomyces sp. 8L]
MSEQGTSADWRSSAAHVMAVSVLFAVPMLKLGWTLGGGSAAREALDAMGPANWLDVVTGMFLFEPLLATVLAVVASRAVYAYLAAKGGADAHQNVPMPAVAAAAAIVPAALAVVVGIFNGLGWGVVCGVLAYLVRLGVLVDYRTGRRHTATGKRTGRTAESVVERAADAVWIAGLALGLLVLPVLAITAALDGRSWSSVVRCDVNTGTGPERARMIELERQASGVVGWDINKSEVANGTNCAADDDVIRAPWWRS